MALIKLTRTNNQDLYISENAFGYAVVSSSGTVDVHFNRNGNVHLPVQETAQQISEKSERFIVANNGTLVLDLDKINNVVPQSNQVIVGYDFAGKVFTLQESIENLFSESTSVGFREIKVVTSNYTIELEDFNKTLLIDSSSAIEITIPNNLSIPFPLDAEVDIVRYGTGDVSFSLPNQVVINGSNTPPTVFSNQYDGLTIKKRGSNSWLITKSSCCGSSNPPTSPLSLALRFTEQDSTRVEFSTPIQSISNHAVSLWFNLISGNSFNPLLGRASDGNGYIQADRGNGEISVNDGTAFRAWDTGAINLSDLGWHHLVVQRDGSDYEVYLDGTQLSLTTRISMPNATLNALSSIDRFGWVNGIRLDGWMNQVVIWSGNLTPTEINNLYNSGNGADPTSIKASPIHLWEFNVDGNGNEQKGTTLFDIGSSGLDGTLVNFTTPDDWVEHASVQNPPIA